VSVRRHLTARPRGGGRDAAALTLLLFFLAGRGAPVNYCRAISQEGNAVWPNATAGTTVQGACIQANGYQGIAVRSCSASAVWGAITTPCTAIEPSCPSVLGYQSRTNWPSATAGSTATGSCALGYTFGLDGAPQRVCLGLGTGAWATNVTSDCVFGTPPKRKIGR